MKIVADRNIPYIADAVRSLGELILLPGDAITADIVRDADILLTRTRTRCDASLLDGSKCTFIGSATIGTDHIDLDYCRSREITVANSPGCSAPAVAQYVLSAIRTFLPAGEPLAGKTLGIIGAGNIGSILNRWALGLGMKTIINDPPREESGDGVYDYRTLAELAAESDFISIHTPYTKEGAHPTFHLINRDFLSMTLRHPLIINAARGAVADTAALKAALHDGIISGAAIDCWENEPNIDLELLSEAVVATPHIAGYSAEGKIRATRMVLEALAAHLHDKFGLEITAGELTAGLPAVNPIPETVSETMLGYDINADHILQNLSAPDAKVSAEFESLRNNYRLRPEPHC